MQKLNQLIKLHEKDFRVTADGIFKLFWIFTNAWWRWRPEWFWRTGCKHWSFLWKIVDGKTNKGIDAVSVQLIQSKFDTTTKKRKDTIVSGMLTRANGEFSLENLPLFGSYHLKISAIGYKAIDQKVAFEMKMPKAGAAQAGQGGGDMSQALAGIDKDLGI